MSGRLPLPEVRKRGYALANRLQAGLVSRADAANELRNLMHASTRERLTLDANEPRDQSGSRSAPGRR